MQNPIIEAAVETGARPEAVARKLASIRDYRHPEALEQIRSTPRLVELMWALQGASHQDGGLRRFASEFLSRFRDRIGTPSLLAVKGDDLSLKQKTAILKELPDYVAPVIPHPYREFESLSLMRDMESDIERLAKVNPRLLAEATAEWDREFFLKRCVESAEAEMPFFLASICIDEGMEFKGPWYFPAVFESLFQFLDSRAETIKAGLVMTEVTSQVFDAMEYCRKTKRMVAVRGNSRFGKTQSLRAYCAMWPGRVRLVTVPPSNSQRSFFRAVADALGMDSTRSGSVERLQEQIRDILRQSGLFLVFDEAARLVPTSYSASTPPSRLEWVRAELFDRGVPVVLGITPQWYDDPKTGALTRYLRKTNYAVEQFLGRCQNLRLPDELAEEDLLKVARFYFPELGRKSDLLNIASYALTSEDYLQAIENISIRARYVAQRDGKSLGMDVIRQAIAWLYPDQESTPEPANVEAFEDGNRHVSGAINKPLNVGSRGVKPAAREPEEAVNLQSCSLRGAGPGRVPADLVSAED